jgi:thioesterase domain-containing protein/acyl carrier protein
VFVELSALPLSSNGKIDRKALPAPDGARIESGGALLAPRDALELELAGIWENLLGVQPVGVRDDFFALGGHSLLAVQLMARIEERFGKALPLATLFQGATVEALAQRLREQPSARRWSPLVTIQPAGRGRPFFCVHPTGGNVLCYAELARHMGQDRPFHGLQAMGHEGDQKPDASIEEMAARYIEALCAVQPEGPYLLGGWSFGGLVAFEMAQQLRRSGQRVERVVLLDAPGPKTTAALADILEDDARLLVAIARESGVQLAYEELRGLGPDEQLGLLLDLLTRANVLPPGFDLPRAKRWFAAFKSNERAAQRYAPPVYPGRLTLLRSSEKMPGPVAQEQQLDQGPTMGWEAFSSQPVVVQEVPGDHLSMMTAPHVQALAESLRRHLREGDAAPPLAPSAQTASSPA